MKISKKKSLTAAITLSLAMGVCSTAMAAVTTNGIVGSDADSMYSAAKVTASFEKPTVVTIYDGQTIKSSDIEYTFNKEVTGSLDKYYVLGGYGSTVAGNKISIDTGASISSSKSLYAYVYGGCAYDLDGKAIAGDSKDTGNTVTISDGTFANMETSTAATTHAYTYGGEAYSKNATAEANGNTVDISGGTLAHSKTTAKSATATTYAYAGGGWAYSKGAAEAINNTLTISGGTLAHSEVSATNTSAKATVYAYGGNAHSDSDIALASGNTVVISGGTIAQSEASTTRYGTATAYIYGGYAGAKDKAEASGNTVTILGGIQNVTASIYGGAALSGSKDEDGYNKAIADNNTVNLGGYLDGNAVHYGEDSAWNSVDLSKATLYGGYGGNPLTGGAYSNNNTLNVFKTASILGIGGHVSKYDLAKNSFQNMNFYIPATVKDGDAMLTVTNAVNGDGATINTFTSYKDSDGNIIKYNDGDAITLIESKANNGLSNFNKYQIDGNDVEQDEAAGALKLVDMSGAQIDAKYITEKKAIKFVSNGDYYLTDASEVTGTVNLNRALDARGNTIDIQSEKSLTAAGGLTDASGITNSGTLEVTGGSLVVNGDVTNNGTVTLINLEKGENEDGSLANAKNKVTGTLVNSGTFNLENTYLTVDKFAGNYLSLDSKSKLFTVTGGSYNSINLDSDAEATLNGDNNIKGNIEADEGTINVSGVAKAVNYGSSVSIGKLNGTGAAGTDIFVVSSANVAKDDNGTLINIGEANNIAIKVDETGNTPLEVVNNNDAAIANIAKEDISTIVNLKENSSLHVNEGLVHGDTTYTGKDTSVNKITKANTANSQLSSALSTSASFGRMEANDIRKRIGDVRLTTAPEGIWARFEKGQMEGSGVENGFNKYQIGADHKVSDKWRVGGAFSYTNGTAEYTRGENNVDIFSLAGYGVYTGKNGEYADIIGRIGLDNTDIDFYAGSIGSLVHQHGKLTTGSMALSGEVGKTYMMKNHLFVEPQAEVMYTHTTGDNFTSNGVNYDLNSMDSLQGRLGFAFGYQAPDKSGVIYTRLSALHEFAGNSSLDVSNKFGSVSNPVDGVCTWWEWAIGGQINFSKSTYFYADIEKTWGAAMDEKYRATAGLRYSF